MENLNEELLDTTDRMKELETGGISLIEEDEYNKLSAANDELERTIALKKIEKDEAKAVLLYLCFPSVNDFLGCMFQRLSKRINS